MALESADGKAAPNSFQSTLQLINHICETWSGCTMGSAAGAPPTDKGTVHADATDNGKGEPRDGTTPGPQADNVTPQPGADAGPGRKPASKAATREAPLPTAVNFAAADDPYTS